MAWCRQATSYNLCQWCWSCQVTLVLCCSKTDIKKTNIYLEAVFIFAHSLFSDTVQYRRPILKPRFLSTFVCFLVCKSHWNLYWWWGNITCIRRIWIALNGNYFPLTILCKYLISIHLTTHIYQYIPSHPWRMLSFVNSLVLNIYNYYDIYR